MLTNPHPAPAACDTNPQAAACARCAPPKVRASMRRAACWGRALRPTRAAARRCSSRRSGCGARSRRVRRRDAALVIVRHGCEREERGLVGACCQQAPSSQSSCTSPGRNEQGRSRSSQQLVKRRGSQSPLPQAPPACLQSAWHLIPPWGKCQCQTVQQTAARGSGARRQRQRQLISSARCPLACAPLPASASRGPGCGHMKFLSHPASIPL